jgi:hypothetical protein
MSCQLHQDEIGAGAKPRLRGQAFDYHIASLKGYFCRWKAEQEARDE